MATFDEVNDRSRRLWGDENFKKICDARVCVLGLGGVGSFVVSSLVRGGVGAVFLMDGDVVDPSNINRQAFAFHSTIGKKKTEIAKNFVADINPDCEVEVCDTFMTHSTTEGVIQQIEDFEPDWIVDAIDSISIKVLLAEHFVKDRHFKNYISAMGAANKYDPTRYRVSTIYKTRNDSLSKIVRKESRKRDIPDFLVCYSDETVALREDQAITRDHNKKILGSASFMPPIVGHIIAGHVLNDLANR